MRGHRRRAPMEVVGLACARATRRNRVVRFASSPAAWLSGRRSSRALYSGRTRMRSLWCGDCAVARRGRGPVASAAPTTTTEKSLTLRSLGGLGRLISLASSPWQQVTSPPPHHAATVTITTAGKWSSVAS